MNTWYQPTSTAISANLKKLYKELCTEARKEFISYLFDEVIPAWRLEIIQATI